MSLSLVELENKLRNTNARWVSKQTPFHSLSDAECSRYLGLILDDRKLEQEITRGDLGLAAGAAAPLEKEVDWRNRNGKNYVTEVKSQEGCGSCVSFCVTGTLESMVLIETGQTFDLSEADLHFCSSHGASCHGWWPSDAIDQVKDRGVTTEALFPYASAFTASGPHCILSPQRDINAIRLMETQTLWTNSDRKWWLANVGPLCASMQVFEDFFRWYGSAVYEHTAGDSLGFHCVQIIGYSDIEGCWIGKNSWNTTWGDNGFFKIAYGQCRIDPSGYPSMPGAPAFPMYGMKGAVLLPEYRVHNEFSKTSPAVCVFNGDLHMVHVGDSSNDLWWSGNGGNAWTPSVTIPGQQSRKAPALAALAGRMHMVHIGESSNDIWHSTFDGIRWTENSRINNQKSKDAPAVVAFGNTICMVHLGDTSNDLWHSFFDGSRWSDNVRINKKSKFTPALALFNGRVHMVYVDPDSNDLRHATFDGTSWTDSVKISGQGSNASPALLEFGGQLHMVHLGDDSNDIWHSVFDGNFWSPNVRLPLKQSKAAPALADFGGHLQMLHIGKLSNQVWQGWVI